MRVIVTVTVLPETIDEQVSLLTEEIQQEVSYYIPNLKHLGHGVFKYEHTESIALQHPVGAFTTAAHLLSRYAEYNTDAFKLIMSGRTLKPEVLK